MNKLDKTYISILISLGLTITDDVVHGNIGKKGELKPITCDVEGVKRTLVIPTRDMQRNGDWSKLVAFHPACENSLNGQSEIISLLSKLISARIWQLVTTGTLHLLSTALDKETQKHFKIAQTKLIDPLTDATKPVLTYASKIFAKAAGDRRSQFRVHLTRGGKIENAKFKQVARLTNPFRKEKAPLFGVKATDTNREAFHAAIELLLPEVREVGTNSTDTPCLEVLLEMFHAVASNYETIRVTLGKKLNQDMPVVELDWYDELSRLPGYYRKYLNQSYPGNTGSPLTVEEPQSSGAMVTQPNFIEDEPTQTSKPNLPSLTPPRTTGITSPPVKPKGRSLLQQMVSGEGQAGYGAPMNQGYGAYQQPYTPPQPQMSSGLYSSTRTAPTPYAASPAPNGLSYRYR